MGIENIKNMTIPLGERMANIDKNIASVRLDKNKFFNLIKDAGFIQGDGSADVRAFNKAAAKVGIDVKDRSANNMQKITDFLTKKSGGSYKNVGMFSAKSIAENAASQSEGFLGEYAEQYSAATKEEFWDDAKKIQRKVNKEKISSADKVKKIARGLKLKWAVPIGTTATLLTKIGFGKALPIVGHLITTEMGSGELLPEQVEEGKKYQAQERMNKRGGGMADINTMTAPLGYALGGPAGMMGSPTSDPESYEGYDPILGNWMKEARMRQAQPPAGAVDMTGQYRPQPERPPWDKAKEAVRGIGEGIRNLFGAKEAGASTLGDDALKDLLGQLRIQLMLEKGIEGSVLMPSGNPDTIKRLEERIRQIEIAIGE